MWEETCRLLPGFREIVLAVKGSDRDAAEDLHNRVYKMYYWDKKRFTGKHNNNRGTRSNEHWENFVPRGELIDQLWSAAVFGELKPIVDWEFRPELTDRRREGSPAAPAKRKRQK
jgi:hypothetical protein